MVEKKNIALCIVFTVLSCGLYGWYWLYCLAEDTNRLTGREGAMSGGLVLLLTMLVMRPAFLAISLLGAAAYGAYLRRRRFSYNFPFRRC